MKGRGSLAILLLTSLCYLRRQTLFTWILNSSFHVRTATSISVTRERTEAFLRLDALGLTRLNTEHLP